MASMQYHSYTSGDGESTVETLTVQGTTLVRMTPIYRSSSPSTSVSSSNCDRQPAPILAPIIIHRGAAAPYGEVGMPPIPTSLPVSESPSTIHTNEQGFDPTVGGRAHGRDARGYRQSPIAVTRERLAEIQRQVIQQSIEIARLQAAIQREEEQPMRENTTREMSGSVYQPASSASGLSYVNDYVR